MSVPPPHNPSDPYRGQPPPQGVPAQDGRTPAQAPHPTTPPAPAPGASSQVRASHGKGTLLAFIALLVIGGVRALGSVGQMIVLELQSSGFLAVPVQALNGLATWTAGPVGLLVLALIAFPYRIGHFVGLGLALFHGLTQLLLSVLTFGGSPVLHALLPLPRSVFFLVAALLIVCTPAAQRAKGMRSPLRIIALCIAGATFVLSGPTMAIVTIASVAPDILDLGLVATYIPSILTSIALVIVVVLAAIDASWSRFVAAGFAVIVLGADILEGIAGFFGPLSDVVATFAIVSALGAGVGAALLVVAGILTFRERRAATPPPSARQPVPAAPPYRP